MRAARPLLAVLLLLAAGCVAPAPEEPVEAASLFVPPQAAQPALDAEVVTDAPFELPHVPTLRPGDRLAIAGTCEATCAPSTLRVEPPAGGWDAGAGWLELRVQWDGATQPGFALRLEGPPGSQPTVERGFDAARVLVPNPPAGDYALRAEGGGPIAGWAALRLVGAPQTEGDDLLPNIVTMVPVEPMVAACDLHERVEQGAQRCLRVGNAIGNVGDGPLEVHLPFQDGLLTPADMGSFSQRIHRSDGTFRDAPVGNADFHFAHGHFHYDGFARFSLHPVDAESGLRADSVAAHHKAGFCFLDWGRMEEFETVPEEGRAGRAETDCLIPGEAGWSMGVSRGWYDYYWSSLTDQYVEITGVPDGLYELVSEADWSGSLEELHEDDNAASLLIRLQGDKVEVLEERAFYRLPEKR